MNLIDNRPASNAVYMFGRRYLIPSLVSEGMRLCAYFPQYYCNYYTMAYARTDDT